ncbi:MAG: aldo/keto reductase [Pyrinomonadaceae bacterium]
MEYRELGKTGLKVSRLGFGGAEIGFFDIDQAEVEQIIRGAVESGLNFVDTAAAYWRSEELLGKCLKEIRKEIVLATKCGAVDGFTRSDWSKDGILDTIRTSLVRLDTDYLDIVQLHSCGSEVLERGEVFEALIVAKEKGYTRFAGYSGDSGDAVAAIETGFFDTLQTSFSIADQEPLELTFPLAKEREMGIIAKRPIANAVWRNTELPEDSYHHEYWNRIQKLRYGFLESPLEESVAHALRFTLTPDEISTAIVGSTKPGRWQQNASSVNEGPLSDGDFEEIRERWAECGGEDWKGQV